MLTSRCAFQIKSKAHVAPPYQCNLIPFPCPVVSRFPQLLISIVHAVSMQVCADCCGLLVARVPANLPLAQRKVACPNCRQRVHLADIATVEAKGACEAVGGWRRVANAFGASHW